MTATFYSLSDQGIRGIAARRGGIGLPVAVLGKLEDLLPMRRCARQSRIGAGRPVQLCRRATIEAGR